MKKLATVIGLIILTASPSYAVEKRCGWVDNPTPGNWFLQDRHSSWIISAQLGYQAQGTDKIPDISRRQYVRTNGNYGYACGCMTVVTDKKNNRILRILSFTQLPLKQCRNDRALPPR